MESYHINELERLTGIKAHTIRIWEKRYELIKPHRTVTNRRYYDDDQLRKLLNVTTLLSHGHKISKIAAFTEKEIISHIADHSQIQSNETTITSYINDLIKSMLAFDEITFEKIFSDVIDRYGIYEGILHVIYPFINKTGVLWSTEKAIPTQEHFATALIRKNLITATSKLPAIDNKRKKFLLFLPPKEWHETGLLFADFIIRSAGHKTIYLGQNVPYDNINKITPKLCPDYLLLFYVAARHYKEIELQLKALSKNNPDCHILVSGNPELFKDIKSMAKNITYLSTVNTLTDFLS